MTRVRITKANRCVERLICWLATALAPAILLAGCTKSEHLSEVRGKVYLGDQPSQKGLGYVTFHPDAGKGNKWLEEASGQIQPDGTYVLSAREKPGAAPGWYKVAVSIANVPDPKNPYFTEWLMPSPEKYSYWDKSGISIEVVEKPQPGQYDIKLPPLTSAR